MSMEKGDPISPRWLDPHLSVVEVKENKASIVNLAWTRLAEHVFQVRV